MVRAVWNDTVLAESDDTVIVEGNHYFPADSVRMDLMRPSDTTSFCGWKGMASYYTAVAGDRTNEDCAWCYADPNPDAAHIRGMVAFWKGVRVVAN